MSSVHPDLTSKVYPEPYTSSSSDEVNHFDLLPDSILLLIFNKIGDVKALGRCCVISRCFYTLVPQVENIIVRVDCVISDDNASSAFGSSNKSRGAFSNLFRFVFTGIVKPFQALGQFLGPKRSNLASSSSSLSGGTGASADDELDQGGVTHHSPTQVLKNFNEIRCLRIEFPNGELGINEGVLFKRA